MAGAFCAIETIEGQRTDAIHNQVHNPGTDNLVPRSSMTAVERNTL